MERLKILLKTSRPIFCPGPVIFYLLGVFTSAKHIDFTWPVLIGLLFVTFPLGLIAFGLNDIADEYSDSINQRKGGVQGNVFSRPQRTLLYKSIPVTFLVALIVLFFISNFIALLMFILVIGISFIYSFPPLRLKSRPILDSLANALAVLFLFLFGKAVVSLTLYDVFIIPKAIWLLVIGVVAVHGLTTIPDYEVDKRSGDRTISQLLTKKGTALLAAFLFIIIYLSFFPKHISLQIYLLTCLLFSLLIAYQPVKKLTIYYLYAIFLGLPAIVLYLMVFESDYINLLLR